MTDQTTPQSPEEYPADVRQELQQQDVTHEGEERQADDVETEDATTHSHMGAVDTEPTPVTPPMSGPDELTEGEVDDTGIDPTEEISGG